MKPQFIMTEAGEELVVLSRREYDALLAQLGDEEAEDRMTVLLANEVRRRLDSGEEDFVSLEAVYPAAASRSRSNPAG
jgi:hypothetical protein